MEDDNHNPWERVKGAERKWKELFDNNREECKWSEKRPKFKAKECNRYLDIHTKRAALSVAPSVVSLISYTGDQVLIQGSGTIIECEKGDNCTSALVLTSANLIRQLSVEEDGVALPFVAPNLKVVVNLSNGTSCGGEVCAYDFHFNLAVVRFKSDSPLLVATLRRVDDSLHLSPTHPAVSEEETSFQLVPHSSSRVLTPGDSVIALGRYFVTNFDIMAAPGQYSLDRCNYDCKELFMSTCRITRCGDGGPIVNLLGEVIGIAYYDLSYIPFMPINVALKWWQHYKTFGELRQPSLGIDAISFHAANLVAVDNVIQKFPSIDKGVYVEKVVSGSPASSAGLRVRDVIIECAGKVVKGFLELFEVVWDNAGKPMELVVIRADNDTPLRLKPMVVEPTFSKLNSWPERKYR